MFEKLKKRVRKERYFFFRSPVLWIMKFFFFCFLERILMSLLLMPALPTPPKVFCLFMHSSLRGWRQGFEKLNRKVNEARWGKEKGRESLSRGWVGGWKRTKKKRRKEEASERRKNDRDERTKDLSPSSVPRGDEEGRTKRRPSLAPPTASLPRECSKSRLRRPAPRRKPRRASA